MIQYDMKIIDRLKQNCLNKPMPELLSVTEPKPPNEEKIKMRDKKRQPLDYSTTPPHLETGGKAVAFHQDHQRYYLNPSREVPLRVLDENGHSQPLDSTGLNIVRRQICEVDDPEINQVYLQVEARLRQSNPELFQE